MTEEMVKVVWAKVVWGTEAADLVVKGEVVTAREVWDLVAMVMGVKEKVDLETAVKDLPIRAQ